MNQTINNNIQSEIVKIDDLMDAAKSLLDAFISGVYGFEKTTAIAWTLHCYYTGIEKILSLIYQDLQMKLEKSSDWHKTLLGFAFEQNRTKGRLFKVELRSLLIDYLKFRHRVRNIYPHELLCHKMLHLVINLQDNWQKVKHSFIDFIEDSK